MTDKWWVFFLGIIVGAALAGPVMFLLKLVAIVIAGAFVVALIVAATEEKT